jgi:hypothetical protein
VPAALFSWLGLVLACLMVVAGMWPTGAHAQPGGDFPRVGQFSLVVGDVVRVDPQGNRQGLKAGDALLEQDRVITGPDAMAMVVFIDKARLAVRPDTELVVRRYRIDPSGAQTRLEFDLLRGTVRQISGEAARQQPDRYRLNTPIAVIGVRGTDFLAKASDQKLETYIHEGIIVLMAARADCPPAAGCPVLAASSAADAGRMLKITAAGAVERLSVMPEDVERIFGIRVLATSRETAPQRGGGVSLLASSASPGAPAFAPLIFADPNARTVQGPAVPSAAVGGSTAGTGNSTSSAAGQTGGASGGTTVGSTSPSVNDTLAAVPGSVPMPSTLVWGRFTDALQIPVTTEPYDSARQGRHVTVGELGQYALWRANPGGNINPALSGRATFGLAMGQAFYRTESSVVAATIDSAKLSADFDLSTFATELRMRTANGVSTLLSATGRINDEGLFLSLAPDGSQRVAGAFSRNGQEAGYLFNKVVGSGVFQGITLWGVRK